MNLRKVGIYMKRITSVLLSAFMILSFAGCGKNASQENVSGDLPPMIEVFGNYYTALDMPVNQLPDGYPYLGELTESQANDTGLSGHKMYAQTVLDSVPDFYVYQQCGTPVDENTIDSEKIQWAYVKWTKCKS